MVFQRDHGSTQVAGFEKHRDRFSMTRMCRVLAVSRSGYCQWRTRAPSDRARSNAALDTEVAALHAVSRFTYGRPRIVRDRHQQGVRVGHERVRRSLKRKGLRTVYMRPYRVTTDSNHRPSIRGQSKLFAVAHSISVIIAANWRDDSHKVLGRSAEECRSVG